MPESIVIKNDPFTWPIGQRVRVIKFNKLSCLQDQKNPETNKPIKIGDKFTIRLCPTRSKISDVPVVTLEGVLGGKFADQFEAIFDDEPTVHPLKPSKSISPPPNEKVILKPKYKEMGQGIAALALPAVRKPLDMSSWCSDYDLLPDAD